ncbi:MAG: hypothetical protein AAF193_07735, partial [Bacteroidota bacterium]
MSEIAISPKFKKQATRSILSVLLFVFIYTLIFAASIALTAACAVAGIVIVAAAPSFITIGIGLALVSLGIVVFIFLVKFIFNSEKIDRSNFIQVTASEQPELFKVIDQLVEKTGTKFPKKVYITPDVNAAVFYNSSF